MQKQKTENSQLIEENKSDSKLHALRQALIEGEESGDAGELDINAIIKQAKVS